MTLVELEEHISEEDYERIEELAMLNCGPRKIANQMGFSTRAFMIAWNTPNHAVRNAYYRGIQELEIVRDAAVLDKLREGNPTIIQINDKDTAARKFNDIKTEVFGLEE